MEGIISSVLVVAAFAVVAGAACAVAVRLYRVARRVQPAVPDPAPEAADA
jgi:hypothetical protein